MQWPKLALIAALILGSATACSESSTSKSEEISVDANPLLEKSTRTVALARADREALQNTAMAACECAVAKGKNCWADYQVAIKPFKKLAGIASACAPVSVETDCLEDASGEFCITTGYNVNLVDLVERRLCKHAEAEALDRAFNAEFAKPGGNQKRAEHAAKEALAAVRAGKAWKGVPSSEGCV